MADTRLGWRLRFWGWLTLARVTAETHRRADDLPARMCTGCALASLIWAPDCGAGSGAERCAARGEQPHQR